VPPRSSYSASTIAESLASREFITPVEALARAPASIFQMTNPAACACAAVMATGDGETARAPLEVEAPCTQLLCYVVAFLICDDVSAN